MKSGWSELEAGSTGPALGVFRGGWDRAVIIEILVDHTLRCLDFLDLGSWAGRRPSCPARVWFASSSPCSSSAPASASALPRRTTVGLVGEGYHQSKLCGVLLDALNGLGEEYAVAQHVALFATMVTPIFSITTDLASIQFKRISTVKLGT